LDSVTLPQSVSLLTVLLGYFGRFDFCGFGKGGAGLSSEAREDERRLSELDEQLKAFGV